MKASLKKARLYLFAFLAILGWGVCAPASAQPNIQICTNYIGQDRGLLTQNVTKTWSCTTVQAETYFTVNVQLVWYCTQGTPGCFPSAIPHPKFKMRAKRLFPSGRTVVDSQAKTINPDTCNLRPTSSSFTSWCNLPTGSYPQAALLVGVYY